MNEDRKIYIYLKSRSGQMLAGNFPGNKLAQLVKQFIAAEELFYQPLPNSDSQPAGLENKPEVARGVLT